MWHDEVRLFLRTPTSPSEGGCANAISRNLTRFCRSRRGFCGQCGRIAHSHASKNVSRTSWQITSLGREIQNSGGRVDSSRSLVLYSVLLGPSCVDRVRLLFSPLCDRKNNSPPRRADLTRRSNATKDLRGIVAERRANRSSTKNSRSIPLFALMQAMSCSSAHSSSNLFDQNQTAY